MLVPLYGFLRGDTIGMIVLIHDNEKVEQIAARLQQAAAVRIQPKTHCDVYFNGALLDPEMTGIL